MSKDELRGTVLLITGVGWVHLFIDHLLFMFSSSFMGFFFFFFFYNKKSKLNSIKKFVSTLIDNANYKSLHPETGLEIKISEFVPWLGNSCYYSSKMNRAGIKK